MKFPKEQRLLLLTILLCLKLEAASAGCLENAEETRRILNESHPKIAKIGQYWCSCATQLRKKTAGLDICGQHMLDDYFDFARTITNCTNIDDFKKLINPHDFCDGFKPFTTTPPILTPNTTTKGVISVINATTEIPSGFTGIIISDPRPPTVYQGIGWILFCAIAVVAIFVFGTILGVLYSRARGNNGNFGFRYFSRTEDDSKSESDIIIVVKP